MNGRIILFGKQIEQITKDKSTAANEWVWRKQGSNSPESLCEFIIFGNV